jgi:hypothetical protein
MEMKALETRHAFSFCTRAENARRRQTRVLIVFAHLVVYLSVRDVWAVLMDVGWSGGSARITLTAALHLRHPFIIIRPADFTC